MNESLLHNDRWLASEFAQGVLEGERLKCAQEKFESDLVFMHEVERWQEYFSVFLDQVAPIPPSALVWEKIQVCLFGPQTKVVPITQSRKSRWVPVAIAASLAFLIGLLPYWMNRQVFEDANQFETLLMAEQSEKLQAEEALAAARFLLQAQQKNLLVLKKQMEVFQHKWTEIGHHLGQRELELAKVRQQADNGVAPLQLEVNAIKEDYQLSQAKLQQLESELDKQYTLHASSVQQVEQLQTTLALREQTIEVLSSPDLELVVMQPTGEDVYAGGNVLWNKSTNKWAFYTFDLPELAENKTYQMWFITEAGSWSAGIFQPNSQGHGVLLAESPPFKAGTVVATAVSLEPAGGVKQPTGPIYLHGKLQ